MKTNPNQKSRPYLSVVIPAYNEEKNIRSGVLEKVVDYLKKQKYSWEVVVADDGSTDDTRLLVKKFVKGKTNFRILEEPHRGKGGIVVAGVLAARGENILFTDMDQSTPLNQVEKFLPKLDAGFDIVIGSRTGRAGAPLSRKFMSLGFSILRTIILRLPYKDTQTGFKAFKRPAAKKVFGLMWKFFEKKHVKGATTSAGFDSEILYIARKKGFKITEVLVDWEYEPGTKKNPIKDSWIGFRGIMGVRIKSLMGVYNSIQENP